MTGTPGSRRLLTALGATAALTVAGVLVAPDASYAQSAYVSSGTSPKLGWGYAVWNNDSSSERVLEACDEGEPDGLRAVAILEESGIVHTTRGGWYGHVQPPNDHRPHREHAVPAAGLPAQRRQRGQRLLQRLVQRRHLVAR